MTRFDISDTSLSGVKLITRKIMGDNRGFLTRLFCAEILKTAGWTKPIAQINQTMTKRKGTVRGMHFQHPPHAEMKLISCIFGEILDIAVDLRKDSPTFLQWHAEKLSAENANALLIPEGVAHGFQTLTDNVELLYCHSAAYSPTFEAGVNPNDPALAILWPLEIVDLSERDKKHPMINTSFEGIIL